MFPPAQYRDSNFESLYLVSKSIFVGTMLSFDDCHTTAHASFGDVRLGRIRS